VLAAQVDAALRARAEAVAATVSVRHGTLDIAEGHDAALDAGTTIYFGQSLVEGVDLSPELREQLVQRGLRSADREALGPVRYLAYPIESDQRQVATIVVSSDTGSRTRTEVIVGAASIVFILLLIVFTFFALRSTIQRALRPVRTMGDQASAWGDQDIDRRFDPNAGPLELRELALTLNALLERIAATVRHERSFTAELSHELRTPLAHLHAEIDLMTTAGETGPEPADPEAIERLMTSVRRIEAMVESALTPARAEQPGALGLSRITDVLADLPAAAPPGPADSTDAGRPRPVATLRVSGNTAVTLAVESDIARRALLPVMENAWRYAVHDVGIDVSTVAGVALIAVSDDGGRLDPALTEAVFTPGFRADPSDGYPGAGLGLALTRRICRSAGGDATATVIDGRTTITLYLPCLDH
jgi:signal transduction histidine kinase